MRLFPAEIDIGPDEGFAPEKDIFGRKEFGDRLTNLVGALEGPAVLILDAPWGTGKTTFVKMWSGALKERGIPSLYFDAFANDYLADAFLALAGEINALAEHTHSKKEIVTKFKDRAISVGKVLGRTAIKLGVQVATAGVISGEIAAKSIDDVAKAVGDGTAEAVDTLIKERLESHNSDKQVFVEFGKALRDLADAIALAEPKQPTHPKLVFIIDELDRCRPTFALELLEKIKHFFSSSSLAFLLVANLKQLEASVKFSYGDEVDARTYLQKFYHLRLLFPGITPSRIDGGADKYIAYLFKGLIAADLNDTYIQGLMRFVAGIAQNHQSDFRTIERIVSYIFIVISSTNDQTFRMFYMVGVLCYLKVVAPDTYAKAREARLTFSELVAILNFGTWEGRTQLVDSGRVARFTGNWWRYILGEMVEDEQVIAAACSINDKYNFRDWQQAITYLCDIIDGLSFPLLPTAAS